MRQSNVSRPRETRGALCPPSACASQASIRDPRTPVNGPAPPLPTRTAQLGPGLLASHLDVCDGLWLVSFRPGSPASTPFSKQPPELSAAHVGRPPLAEIGPRHCSSGPRAQLWCHLSPPLPPPTLPRLLDHAGCASRPLHRLARARGPCSRGGRRTPCSRRGGSCLLRGSQGQEAGARHSTG